MPEPPCCPKCGAILLPDAPAGNCHRCLLSLASDWPDGASNPEATLPKPVPTNLIHYFGDYELLEQIGHGGMGKVWRARQVSLNRIVALKMIHAGRFAGPEETARFRREAEAAASLDHPNIVPIYEVGEHEGQQYFTMKLVAGRTLAQRLGACEARNSDWIRRAALLIATIARALHHAHQRGVLHRDIKPGNILLDAEGEPHLADFGLARFIDNRVNLTPTQGFIGTPGYMAPEQLTAPSKDLTAAIDLHALGCVLYECLTGAAPYQAETHAEALRKLATAAVVSPRRLNRAVDRDLETICLVCLDREPARRYPAAAALAADLDRWLRREPVNVRPASAFRLAVEWGRRHPLHSALVAILGGPLLLSTYFVLIEIPHRASAHSIVGLDRRGECRLEIYPGTGTRCTLNFARTTFKGGRYLRLFFQDVPADWLPRMSVRIQADQPGWPDPPRTPVLTNGQVFWLQWENIFDRAYYCVAVDFAAEDLVAVATNAKIVLLRASGPPVSPDNRTPVLVLPPAPPEPTTP